MTALIRINSIRHPRGSVTFPLLDEIVNTIKIIALILFMTLFLVLLLLGLFFSKGEKSNNTNQPLPTNNKGPDGYYYSNTTTDGVRSIKFIL